MKLCLPVIGAVLALTLTAGAMAQEPVQVYPGSVNIDEGADAEIPIVIDSADGIVGMHIEILYDPAIFEYVDMRRGNIFPSGAKLEVNPTTPGRVVTGFASIDEVIGSGDLLRPVFRANDGAETATIGLDNVEAWDSNGFDVLIQTQTGTVTIAADSGFPIWLGMVIACLLVLLLAVVVLIFMLLRRVLTTKQPTYVPPVITSPPAPESAPESGGSEPHTMIVAPPEFESKDEPPAQTHEIDQTQELVRPVDIDQYPRQQATDQGQRPDLPDQVDATLCPNCGAPATDETIYCTNCGHRLA